MTAGLEEVAALVRASTRFLLLTHRGPDGDGLGSMVGLSEILRGMGKHPTLLLPDGAPEPLRQLAGVREASREIDAKARFDAAFVFDTGDPRLLQGSLPPPEVSGRVVVLDHHAVAVEYGDLCWRDPQAAAVGVMVYRLASWTYVLAKLLVRLPDVSLVNLVLGRRVVPELIQADANPERIAEEAARLLTDAAARDEMRASLAELRQRLGERGASGRAAAEVAAMLAEAARN